MREGEEEEEKGRPDTKPSANRVTHPESGCGSDWITYNTP